MAVALPERYRTPWRPMLLDELKERLVPGVRILDVGSGRTPAISVQDRPLGCVYVGLDIDRNELELAPTGGYTDVIEADASVVQPELVGKFDIVLSWQLLEHVRSTASVIDAMHAYLRPGGVMVSMLSGKNTLFAIPNRIIPFRLGVFAMEKLLRRPPDTVFPAVYDLCTYDELSGALSAWTEQHIRPFWRGASYLQFSSGLRKAYLAIEEQFYVQDKRNLATHYLIVATR